MTTELRQIGVFVAVGIASAVIDLGGFQLLLGSGWHHAVAASVSFCASLVANYWMQSRLTFRAKPSGQSAFRFCLLVLINLGITLISVELAVWMGLGPMIGKIAGIPLVAINSYSLSKHWVYR